MGSLELHELRRFDGACILSVSGELDETTVAASGSTGRPDTLSSRTARRIARATTRRLPRMANTLEGGWNDRIYRLRST